MKPETRNAVLLMMAEGQASCFSCVFCQTPNRADVGRCRKNAPHRMDGSTDARWPTVAKTDWCGEFYPIVAVEVGSGK